MATPLWVIQGLVPWPGLLRGLCWGHGVQTPTAVGELDTRQQSLFGYCHQGPNWLDYQIKYIVQYTTP